jgi:metal-responsive CopG/Arc/MetJ family transcriptional regulator
MRKLHTPRTRVTVSLPAPLVKEIDRLSKKTGATRSGLVEVWLRDAQRRASQSALDEDIERYYRELAGESQDQELSEVLEKASIATLRNVDWKPQAGRAQPRRPKRRRR